MSCISDAMADPANWVCRSFQVTGAVGPSSDTLIDTQVDDGYRIAIFHIDWCGYGGAACAVIDAAHDRTIAFFNCSPPTGALEPSQFPGSGSFTFDPPIVVNGPVTLAYQLDIGSRMTGTLTAARVQASGVPENLVDLVIP